LLVKAGAVGDVCARFFDKDGRELPSAFADRIVGITLDDLRNSPLSIGVGGGPNKVPPLLAALRGRFFKVLVTDEQTALSILELDQLAPDQ
jgi:lsr operon transcriptional repressor